MSGHARARRLACSGAIVVATMLAPSSPVAAADAPPTIGTFAIGEATSAVRAEHGDPLRFVRVAADVVSTRYPVVGGAVFVVEKKGVVVGLTLNVDPSPVLLGAPLADDRGVRLGMTHDAVLAAHDGPPLSDAAAGTAWRDGADVVLYTFGADGRLASINMFDPKAVVKADTALAGVLVPPGEHDGSSGENAIVIAMTSDISGRWERFSYAYNPCDGKTLWKESSSSLVLAGGRSIDRNAVTCPTTGVKRDLFFDVTAGMAANRKLFQAPH
jgi:hypothetical protein